MSLVHFDTRKLSRVGSAVILVSLVGLPVVLGLLIAVLAIGFGLQSGQDWRVMGTVSGVAKLAKLSLKVLVKSGGPTPAPPPPLLPPQTQASPFHVAT